MVLHRSDSRQGYRMLELNMMCAFGVPGNISQGCVADDFAEIPVDASVAYGM